MTYKKRMALQRDNVSLRLDVVGGEPLEPAGETVLRMPLVDGVPSLPWRSPSSDPVEVDGPPRKST